MGKNSGYKIRSSSDETWVIVFTKNLYRRHLFKMETKQRLVATLSGIDTTLSSIYLQKMGFDVEDNGIDPQTGLRIRYDLGMIKGLHLQEQEKPRIKSSVFGETSPKNRRRARRSSQDNYNPVPIKWRHKLQLSPQPEDEKEPQEIRILPIPIQSERFDAVFRGADPEVDRSLNHDQLSLSFLGHNYYSRGIEAITPRNLKSHHGESSGPVRVAPHTQNRFSYSRDSSRVRIRKESEGGEISIRNSSSFANPKKINKRTLSSGREDMKKLRLKTVDQELFGDDQDKSSQSMYKNLTSERINVARKRKKEKSSHKKRKNRVKKGESSGPQERQSFLKQDSSNPDVVRFSQIAQEQDPKKETSIEKKKAKRNQIRFNKSVRVVGPKSTKRSFPSKSFKGANTHKNLRGKKAMAAQQVREISRASGTRAISAKSRTIMARFDESDGAFRDSGGLKCHKVIVPRELMKFNPFPFHSFGPYPKSPKKSDYEYLKTPQPLYKESTANLEREDGSSWVTEGRMPVSAKSNTSASWFEPRPKGWHPGTGKGGKIVKGFASVLWRQEMIQGQSNSQKPEMSHSRSGYLGKKDKMRPGSFFGGRAANKMLNLGRYNMLEGKGLRMKEQKRKAKYDPKSTILEASLSRNQFQYLSGNDKILLRRMKSKKETYRKNMIRKLKETFDSSPAKMIKIEKEEALSAAMELKLRQSHEGYLMMRDLRKKSKFRMNSRNLRSQNLSRASERDGPRRTIGVIGSGRYQVNDMNTNPSSRNNKSSIRVRSSSQNVYQNDSRYSKGKESKASQLKMDRSSGALMGRTLRGSQKNQKYQGSERLRNSMRPTTNHRSRKGIRKAVRLKKGYF